MATIHFKGKNAVWNHHLSVPYHTLEKDEKKSLEGANSDDNLIIEGDNLLALKALLPKYQGKVKCIYIDPPYNTGNESWVYNDNVNSPVIKSWMGEVVGKEGEDLTRHDKWLCMMTPRLKLLRELLSEEGVIFVSIDDNEQHHLRNIMNEVFGEGNFVVNIIWQKKYAASNDNRSVSDTHDFVVCFAKNILQWQPNLFKRSDELNDKYKNPDNDSRGAWYPTNLSVKTFSEKNFYKIISPSGKEFLPPPSRCWVVSQEKYKALLDDNRIWFGKNGDSRPYQKTFLSEVQQGVVPESIWLHKDAGHNIEAKSELRKLFENQVDLFDTPKPTRLVKRVLELSTDKNSIILDAFAGSGVTAQAVMDLNAEDGGNRKFVIVEMEKYANSITAERVRRVIKTKKYDTGFTYAKLGQAIDAATILSGTLPKFKDLAKCVYYLATGRNLEAEKDINAKTGFVGKSKNESVYLLYEQDLEVLKKLAITLNWARATHESDSGKKIVYAPACYLDDEMLDEFNIQFVSIPYNLFARS
jgi:adenine-specific DNA-methyltransferase